MTSDIAFIDPAVASYLAAHTTPPSPLEQRLIDETQQLPRAQMQIGFPQARFMALLARILKPTTVVEIGVFTGYSALVVAQELEPSARLIACDISEEWTSVGRRYWAEAGVADRIDLRIGPASETLAALPSDTRVDMAFIDADKTGYLGYLDQLIPLMHERSVVLVDNVLWDSRVVDPTDQSEDTVALRAFSAAVLADKEQFDRVYQAMREEERKAQLESMYSEAAHELGETTALVLREPDELMTYADDDEPRLPVTAGLLSLFLPGTGQLLNGAEWVLTDDAESGLCLAKSGTDYACDDGGPKDPPETMRIAVAANATTPMARTMATPRSLPPLWQSDRIFTSAPRTRARCLPR